MYDVMVILHALLIYYQVLTMFFYMRSSIPIRRILVWICAVHHQARPLSHLPKMPPRVVEVLYRGEVSVLRQDERVLQAGLVLIKEARKNCDVIRLVEDLVYASILCITISRRHVTQNFACVRVPKLFADARRSVAVRSHDKRLDCRVRIKWDRVFW